MPVEKEYSIVADSTISSSPQIEGHVDGEHDASTLPIKRPARTYGRRREEPLVDGTESLLSASSSLAPHSAAHNIIPLEVVPSSSPRTHFTRSAPLCSHSDDERTSGASPKFVFDWKKKFQQMDEDDDDDEAVKASVVIKGNDAPARTSFGQPSLLQHSSIASFPSDTSSEGQISQPLPIVSHDLFGEDSLSRENRSSPQVAPAKETFSLSSPQVAPRARARLSNVIHDSDSEPEPSKASSSTTPSSSSQPLHNITTPMSRSLSTTPPTSDDEMPAKISAKARSSGKRKSLGHSRPSVPRLDLIEGPLSEPKIRSGTKNRSKVKAPTKKDRQEMLKEQTRLAAGSTVSIPRETVSKYTVEGLFAKIRGSEKQLVMSAPTLELLPLSDPIEAYSSPPANPRGTGSERVASTSYLPRVKVSKSKSPRLPTGNDSDSEDLPEVSEVIKGVEVQKKKQELQELKKRAMEMLQNMSTPKHHQVDSDDDLQIVDSNAKTRVKDEEGRRSAKKQPISQTRKQQMQLARVNPAKQKRNEEASLLRAHGNGEGFSSIVLQHSGRLDQTELSRVMAAQAQIQAREVAQRKANEWKKHGGHLPVQLEVPAEGLVTTMQTIAEKGIKAAEASIVNRMHVEDDDDDDDDGDWVPTLRGSASPEPVENHGEASEEESDENIPVEQDITMAEVDNSDEVEEAKIRATRRMVVVSDDEDENEENVPPSASNRYRRATSSAELPTEDEYDKENNTELMYDRSDDKENTAVVRHTLTGSSRSIFDIVAPLSPDGISRELNFRSQRLDADNESSGKSRRPFKELLSDESPSSKQQGPSSLTQSFAAQLQQASPLPSTLSPAPALKSYIGVGLSSDKSFSGFSQISEPSDSDVFAAAPLLQPGFSDLFESTTQKQRSPTRLNNGKGRARADEALSDDANPRVLKHSDTLDLTQDVSVAINLQPAFQVGENLMRKADAIFEKEQAYIVETALHKPPKKPELYVNNHGFLTQTRPADGTPEVYRSQTAFASDNVLGSMLSPSQSRPRAPLRTLSISSTYQPDSPEHQPLRRLRKNVQHSSSSETILNSPTTPPLKQNAFDLLTQGAAKAHKRDEKKQRRPNIDLSEFFENEAAESDEENNRFGMVVRQTDDEENEEDLDQTLDVLMDDKEMDEETVAAGRVLEKYKEQEEEQDKKDQELHEAAISGRLRLKRNRGVGIDDSDEESDDDDNERARRAMKKLRSSDRGDIKDLEANEATRPFAETYIQSLKDDDEELSYLAVEANFDDLLGDNKASHNPELEDDADEDEDEEQETISPQEIRRRARQMIEEGVEEPQIDPLDVSWVDKDPDDDAPRVKTVRSRQRVPVSRNDMDLLEMDGSMSPFAKPADQFNASSKQWCAQENKFRNAGTSRSVGGSAITGHTKAKAEMGTRTSHKGARVKTESASTSRSKSLRPERSMLSAIVDKSRHFG